ALDLEVKTGSMGEEGRDMAIRHMLIGSASALGLLAGTAHAQSTDPNQPPTNAPPSGNVQAPPSDTGSGDIVITGIRGSAAASIRAKRASSVISDVLTAEDYRKVPRQERRRGAAAHSRRGH